MLLPQNLSVQQKRRVPHPFLASVVPGPDAVAGRLLTEKCPLRQLQQSPLLQQLLRLRSLRWLKLGPLRHRRQLLVLWRGGAWKSVERVVKKIRGSLHRHPAAPLAPGSDTVAVEDPP